MGWGVTCVSGSGVTQPWGSRWPCWSRVGVEMLAGSTMRGTQRAAFSRGSGGGTWPSQARGRRSGGLAQRVQRSWELLLKALGEVPDAFGPCGPLTPSPCPPGHLPICFSACLCPPASLSVGLPRHLLSGLAGSDLCVSVTCLPGLHPTSPPADFLPVCQPMADLLPPTCLFDSCLSVLLSACETKHLSPWEAQSVPKMTHRKDRY